MLGQGTPNMSPLLYRLSPGWTVYVKGDELAAPVRIGEKIAANAIKMITKSEQARMAGLIFFLFLPCTPFTERSKLRLHTQANCPPYLANSHRENCARGDQCNSLPLSLF